MEVSRGKKRLCPAEEFVALCGGDIAIATELATLHRDYVVAALALNVAARGAKANVVSFGDVAEAYVAKQLAPTGLVDVAGRFPHPEALLSLKGDVQKKIESGAFFNAPTKRVTYVAADSAAAAIARICGFVVVVTFHVDLFEGHGDVLGELAKLRSKRMEDVWDSLSDEERAAWCSAIRDGVANMSAEAKAKLAETRRVNSKAAYDAGKLTGAFKKGHKHSEASKAKMSAAKVGNNNNTHEDTIHVYCPNPACRYRGSYSQRGRDFKKHLAQCSACADVVRKALAEDDPEGVLFGWKPGSPAGWPKWLPPKKPKK
jgi:hypothetical protein